MKKKKTIKKAVWRGYAIKNIATGNFSRLYSNSPELNVLRALLETESTSCEKVVKVEVKEI